MSSPTIIRFATLNDEPALLAFLDAHWRKDHIFVTHPEVMRWQHMVPQEPTDSVTFLLAERQSFTGDTEIIGVLGFIPFYRFHGNPRWTEISLAIWKVRDDAGMPGLGIQMLKKLQSTYNPDMIAAIGISNIVKPMYKAMGYTLGRLHQAALFPEDDPDKRTRSLNVPDAARQKLKRFSGVSLQKIECSSENNGDIADEIDALGATQAPRKSWAYLVARYQNHPSYRYYLRAVISSERVRAIIVWRRVAAPFGNILRIVDIIGDPAVLAFCGALFRTELKAANACYIDIMGWGIDKAILSNGGFMSLDDYPDLILPNHFSPYEARNIQVDLAVKTADPIKDRQLRLYRADSDQDRPNQPADLNADDKKGLP